MLQIPSFCSRPGKSTKNTPSKISARANSGGSFEASLQVPTKKTPDSWSLSRVRSEPKTRGVTSESVWPELVAPANSFFHSSAKTTHGAIASANRSACRTLLSLWPTSEPKSCDSSPGSARSFFGRFAHSFANRCPAGGPRFAGSRSSVADFLQYRRWESNPHAIAGNGF